ncbi:hypothetical protein NE865_03940 [Phthorimaea operculella]|nr:hypothetical protein NE865_03940 [Phthorimaea operculella]
MPTCGSCKEPIVYSGESLPCKKCRVIYHHNCLNITSAEFREKRHVLMTTFVCNQCNYIHPKHCENEKDSLTDPTVFKSPLNEKDDSLMSCDGSGRDDAKFNVNLAPRNRDVAEKKQDDNISVGSDLEPIGRSSPNLVLSPKSDVIDVESVPTDSSSPAMLKIQEMFSSLTSSLTALKDSVMACHEEITAVRSELTALKHDVNNRFEKNEEDIQQLHHEIIALRSEIDHRDRMHQLNNVEISGVTESSGENLNHIVTLLATKLGVNLDPRDVDYVARAGKRRPVEDQPARPRPIIVRFTRRVVRDELLRAARTRRNLSTDLIEIPGERRSVYVNEHLIKSDRQLYGKARSVARELNFKYVWKKNGRILIKKTDHGETYHIRSENDLFQFQN